MQQTSKIVFPNFPDESKVWAYNADRFLSENEVLQINHSLVNFLNSWASHGKKLTCDGMVLHNALLVLVVNETSASASGCSIDTSTHFVKELEKELNVSFFNRLRVLVKQDGELKFISYHDFQQDPTPEFFDLSIEKLGDIREKWPL